MPPIHPRGAALAAAALILALAAPAGAVTPNGRLQIIHLDVGQGDGALIISPLGQVVLIDEGPSGVTPAMGVTVVNQLRALGVTHVDYHFASHYHADHIGNIAAIVAAPITIDYGWDRGGSYSSGQYTSYVTALGTKRRTMVKNQVVLLDSLAAHPVVIKCVDLAGAGISTTDENSLSMVLKVSYGEFDETFGGDLPGANSGSYSNIETTVGPEAGPVEVYKVHHHGSATSSLTDWLGATGPKIGVISEGNGNSYGHPTSSALTRLHNAGVHTYWTETGAGVAPNAAWDKVSNGQVIISATWEPAGVDTVRGNGFADTFTNSGSADLTPPSAAITSPGGGEDWKAGSSHAITWTATDNLGVTSVDLAYSTDGGASFPNAIATGIANSGSYAWSVPNVPTQTARVRVVARDAAGNAGSGTSTSNFAISTWTITASAGPGGSIAPSGAVGVVQGASPHFSIAPATGHHVTTLAVDGGAIAPDTAYTFPGVTADHTIAATFSADAYALTVATVGAQTVTKSPDQPSYLYGSSVQLTATPAAGWAFTGWSGDAGGTANPLDLTITGNTSVTATAVDVQAPAVAVTSPEGGEQWTEGTVHTISWSATDNAVVDSVNVDFSSAGPGGPWSPIAHALSNSGSYPWTVPSEPSDFALVRVTVYDHALNAASDASDSVFHVVSSVTGVGGGGPAVLALARPQPNPGSGATRLRFTLPRSASARLEILDIGGRCVWRAEGIFPAGSTTRRWDGVTTSGGQAGAGLYFVRLVSPWGARTERLVWLR
jgi:beta-lactamase superfamily II metal-dependent hydrolase